MRAFVLVLLISLSSSAVFPARAGAWLWPEGKGQVIVTTTFANARNAYDASGRLIQTPSYRKFETRAYVEHGVTDWLNFVGEASFMSFRGSPNPGDHLNLLIEEAKAGLPLSGRGPPGARYEGLGLGSVGARLRLFTYEDYIFSFEMSLRGASQDARRFLDMRDPTQIDARFLMGRPFSLFGMSGFMDTQVGLRTRGQNGDEIRMDFTAGIRPVDRLMLMAQSFSAFAPRGGVATFVAAQKFQLSAVYEVTPSISLQLGGVTALEGVNSPAERGIVSALWWRY
jgi:protein XagA